MTNQKTQRPLWRKTVLIFIPIFIGLSVFCFMSFLKKAPRQKAVIIKSPTVRVMKIKPMDLMPRAFGHGTAEPIRVWKAIAQVSGKIIFAHPQLQKGKTVRKDTVLLGIDPSEYKISISQLKIKIQIIKIQIEELKVQEENSRKQLGVTALVRVPGETLGNHVWQAELNRFSDTMDRETRTMGLIFVVNNAMELNPKDRKRPIINGMYFEIELPGKLIKDALVIPHSAIYPGNTVYLMTADKKLQLRIIEPGFRIENIVFVQSGLKAGETLILSDVIPAVAGMTVDPVANSEAVAAMMLEAKGADHDSVFFCSFHSGQSLNNIVHYAGSHCVAGTQEGTLS